MEPTNNNNNNNLFLCELKELRNEISGMKKRIVQLEESHEAQQERLDILERENKALKIQLNIDGNTAVGPVMKRKRTDQDQDNEEEIESKSISASASAGKKKTKTNNNDNEAIAIPRRDNGDSFDSLSDDLLHKIVEFDGNCYENFGSINKRCKNIYDVEEYKLKKETCVFGYGTVEMMLLHYLQKRREGMLQVYDIAKAVVTYGRLDAIDWIIQLGDNDLLERVCYRAASYGRISILSNVFCKLNLTMLDKLLNDTFLCDFAAPSGHLETLKWVRKFGAQWDKRTFFLVLLERKVQIERKDKIIQYLRAEGCPEAYKFESSESEEFDSDDEDGDY